MNGEFLDQKEAAVSVADRGFVFGDGVYEVTRVVNGKFFQEQEHLDRLDEGLEGLKINLNRDVRNSIPEISRELIKRNDNTKGEATVYLQITRGAAFPRSHTFPDPEVPATVYLSSGTFNPHKKLHEMGVEVITVPDVRWTRCNLKTINLLPNTLARQQAKESGANSAVMIRDGVITESPNANIFAVKAGTLYTFPASNYILNGITRRVVIDIAKNLNIPLVTEPVRRDDLYELDELFFTGTTTDIQPIIKADGRNIGSGKPGEIVQSIQKEYNKRLYS